MPITPFHLGPGTLIKAIIPGWFSLSAFTLAQLIIDGELGYYYFIQQEQPYHRFLHSYAGASVVLVVCLILAKPICQLWLKLWNKIVVPNPHSRLYVLDVIPYRSIVVASILGVYSHIFLDSLISEELQPFYPWFTENSLYGSTNLVAFYFALLVIGTIGVFWLLLMTLTHKFGQ